MSTISDQATALISGYKDADRDTVRLTKVRHDMIAANWGAEIGNALTVYQDALATSDDINVIREAFDAYATAQASQRAFTTIQADLNALGTAQRTASRSFSAEAVEPALLFLNDHLADLMRSVRALHDTLGDVNSIERALNGSADIVKAWREIEAAADQYEAIRAAQNRITISIVNDGNVHGTALRRHGRIRNAFEDESFWVQSRLPRGKSPSRTRHNTELLDWVENPPPAKWHRAETEIWPDDRIGYLRWLATDSTPWVPTIAQLATVSAQVDLLTRRFEFTTEIRAALDAYDAYYQDVTLRRPLNTAAIRNGLPRERRADNRDSEGRTIADPRIVAAYE